ncbi:T9SS type A sorting domain-containing protein [Lacinutrix sp. WUR7]|uniref:T9SS type A sorting domain-containing protein n=1 Tax=Lacinutrix sp. WUR7 TaxID=2653681 RepID=UPI00193E59E3|nr:T9SS type A sorting domain-containing protein [Lacinutrix sp. WUR7]QRM90656.1 T9SS type A sorting domain-containing protein [Lacinutrix sp. WUR7]
MRRKYFICNSLILFNFLCCYSQIVNEGILNISAATDVYFENEYTNSSSGIHKSSGNLYLNNNFINNGTTESSLGTTYFKSSNNPLLSISGTSNAIHFNNLEVDITAVNKKGITVADGFALNVANSISLSSGDLRLIDEAQLIQTHVGVDANTISIGKILIDQQGYASAYKFNYWASPVNNSGTFSFSGGLFDGTDSSLNLFDPQQTLFNTGSPHNGTPSVLDGLDNVTTALSINRRWLYKYLQGTGSYYDWVGLNESSSLNPGEGYTMKGTNTLLPNQNYVFYGAPNNGDYSLPINIGEESLLGNPYPSALNASKFILDNLSILDTLYFWVDGGSTSHLTTDYLGGYAIRNLSGGIPASVNSPSVAGVSSAWSVTPKQYVSVGQGFFVNAYGNGPIVFNNSQREFKTESSGNTIFLKTSDAADNNTELESNNQYLRIGYEDPEGFHRQLLLAFLPDTDADINYNRGYDALIMEHRDDDLFYVIDNELDKKYAIQGLGGFEETLEFPLGILISETGSHQIMIDAVENFENTVYLKDNFLNTTHDLSASNFNINLPIGEYLDRYSIVFSPEETLSTNDQTVSNIDVFYAGNENIVVYNQNRTQIKSIKIFNVLGQEVLTRTSNLNANDKIEIPFNKSKGIYFVKVEAINSELTKKISNY